jgi:hypothetical protein
MIHSAKADRTSDAAKVYIKREWAKKRQKKIMKSFSKKRKKSYFCPLIA